MTRRPMAKPGIRSVPSMCSGIVDFVPAGHAGDFESGAGREPAFNFVGDFFLFAGIVFFVFFLARLGSAPLYGDK